MATLREGEPTSRSQSSAAVMSPSPRQGGGASRSHVGLKPPGPAPRHWAARFGPSHAQEERVASELQRDREKRKAAGRPDLEGQSGGQHLAGRGASDRLQLPSPQDQRGNDNSRNEE